MFQTSSEEQHHEQQQQPVNDNEKERAGGVGEAQAHNLSSDQQQQQQQKEPPQASNQQQQQLPSSSQKIRASQQYGLHDRKVIGLKNYGLSQSTYAKRQKKPGGSSMHSGRSITHFTNTNNNNNNNASGRANIQDGSVFSLPLKSVEELEDDARRSALTNRCYLLYLGNMSAVKVMIYFLVTWETILTSLLTAGLTCYWYFTYLDDPTWKGNTMDFILLAFAVISPISAALGMAFQRRERALIAVADFRSFAYHLYLAHAVWDWPENGGRAGAELNQGVNWIEHCDAVMAQLIGIGDELSRFLSLPTATKSRHRMTRQGRREAAQTMEVSYYLLESMCSQRMTRLMFYSERIKKIGLPAGEMSRIRQYERFLSDLLEQLRVIKLYRTPQTLRSFARIFTMILPPFYAPVFAQVARDYQSLGMGIAYGIITALGLSALFEGLEVLEDPFTAYLALDGIDVREEFEVLHFAQLLSTRRLVFPNAPNYPPGRRTALIGRSSSDKHHLIGLPPTQVHHERYQHSHGPSRVPSLVNVATDSHGPSRVPSLVNVGTVAMADAAPATVFSAHDNTTYTDDEDAAAFDLDDHVDMELGSTLMGEEDQFLANLRRETGYGDDDDTMVNTVSRSPTHHHRGPRSLSGSTRLSRRRRWDQQQQI